MLTVPEWVREAVTTTHAARWSALCVPRFGSPFALPVTSGNLRTDAAQTPRTQATMTLGDLSQAPQQATDALLPFGTRVLLRYTVSLPDGRTHTLTPAPALVVDSVEVSRGESVGMTLTAADESLVIATDSYPAPSEGPAADRSVAGMLRHLILRTFPRAGIDDEVMSDAWVGRGYVIGDDPWQAVEDLCDGIGAECFVTPDDRYRIRRIPSLSAPVGILATGPGGTVTGTRSAITRGVNRVALRFRDPQGRLVVGLWADTSAVLGVGTDYGRVTLVETRDREATQAEADAAAERYARRAAGRVRDVQVEAVPQPWYQPGDTLSVVIAQRSDALVLTGTDHDLTGQRATRYTFRTDTVGPS